MSYIPVDLRNLVNSADDVEHILPPAGEAVLLRGIPFLLCQQDGAARIVRVAPGRPVTIPIDTAEPCSTITFAHRAVDDAGAGLAPVGRVDAVYRLAFADGQATSMEVREGYEIAPVRGPQNAANWGALPSLAVPDQRDSVPDRYHGSFSDAGYRGTEVVEASRWFDNCGPSPAGWRFYLWALMNPRPGHRVVSIELEAAGTTVDVGGVCLGFVAEHPLRPDPARTVVVTLDEAETAIAADLAIKVDRGTAGYTTVVPAGRLMEHRDALTTWGDDPGSAAAAVYARVSAIGSATVSLVRGDEVVSKSRWSDITRKAPEEAAGRLRVAETGRNWVRTSIVDDETGNPLTCRVSFSSPDGVPYQPYGHHQHVNSDLPSWHVDVGSDVRLGRTTYAYIDGSCAGWLPRGGVRVQVTRGFDYQPVDDIIKIDDETRELTIRARRLCDPSQDRWFSGDTHVHFVSSFGGLREAAAEGVSVVHLLQSQWGSLFTSTEEFLGRPVSSADGKTILFTSQENRQHFLGHLSLLGLRQSVAPWCSGGPPEAEMGGGLEATLSDWADRCHDQDGTVVVPHFPAPNGELATLIATERVDALEWGQLHQDRAFSEYYRYLNAGFRLPLAGGTDKMSNDVPIGLSRTYVRLSESQDFSFDSWCEALRSGRSYMSSGPLLDFAVNGAGVGETVFLPGGGGVVSVSATATSIFPIFKLEVIYRGSVVASSDSSAGATRLEIRDEIRVDRPGWICVRVGGGGPSHLTRHRDEQRSAIMAHSSPVYIACDQQHAADSAALRYTMTLVDRARSYVTDLASMDTGSDVRHHHGADHREFLLRPFDQAQVALERRLRLAKDW
jgi:hypothetical protein